MQQVSREVPPLQVLARRVVIELNIKDWLGKKIKRLVFYDYPEIVDVIQWVAEKKFAQIGSCRLDQHQLLLWKK